MPTTAMRLWKRQLKRSDAMDLGATINMATHNKTYGDWDEIAERQGIDIPRMRGYRFMAGEEPITDDEVERVIRKTIPRWLTEPGGCVVRIKGRGKFKTVDKRQVKGEYRMRVKSARRQYAAFNRYVGQPDIVMVHCRAGSRDDWIEGGGIWIQKQPWFIERVRDTFDETYCDVYIRILPGIEEQD